MQHGTSAIDSGRRELRLQLTFASAVVSLVAVFAAEGSTIPLFTIYRTEDGFTNAGISLTLVAYSAATLSTLLVLLPCSQIRLAEQMSSCPSATGRLRVWSADSRAGPPGRFFMRLAVAAGADGPSGGGGSAGCSMWAAGPASRGRQQRPQPANTASR
jgi:hypothetical protein